MTKSIHKTDQLLGKEEKGKENNHETPDALRQIEKQQQEDARATENARQRERLPVGHDSRKDPGTARHLRKEAAEAKHLKRYILWTPRLEEWFDKPARELPKKLHLHVKKELNIEDWDSLSPDERRRVASDWDSQHDPANEQLQRYWFDLLNEINEIEEEIEKWKAVSCRTARDLELRDIKIAALSKVRADKEKELSKSQIRGFRAGHRNTELQYAANELAKAWQEKNERFSKRDIAKELLKFDRWAACFKTYERIERILLKEW